MFDFGGFKASKLKPQLKMAVSRFSIASNKKSALMKQSMREIAVLLADEPPKEEKARIKAEALIRDDNMIEAYEILSLECELLSERTKLLESTKTCPKDLVSTISDLIYACTRVDIPELVEIRKQFRAKYGKEFEEAALHNKFGNVNERVVSKLSVHPPAAYLVQTYLERIAEQFEVDWQPTIKLSAEQMIEPMAAPIGFSVQSAQGTGLGPAAQPTVTTGIQNADEEINYQKFSSNGSSQSIPPAAPSGFGSPSNPVVSATAYVPNGGDTVASPLTQQTNLNGEKTPDPDNNSAAYDEVDIFVPQIPTAPPGTETPTNGKKSGNDDDDQDENSKPPPTNGSTPGAGNSSSVTSSTYEDLAARFEQLKK